MTDMSYVRKNAKAFAIIWPISTLFEPIWCAEINFGNVPEFANCNPLTAIQYSPYFCLFVKIK